MSYKPQMGNIALAAVSVLVAYFVVEFFVFPAFLSHIPLKFQMFLGNLRPLSQSSKTGRSPRNYIGLMGDSYAQGQGDWLLATDPNMNGSFHSAHVIHDLTGRDVISFGQAGAGSIDGIMIRPIQKFNRINSSWLYRLERPSVLIVYFYEGNDLNGNLKTIRKYVTRNTTNAGPQLENFVQQKYNEAANATAGSYRNAYAAKFFWAMIRYNLGWDREPRKRSDNQETARLAGSINSARVEGTTVALPDDLQSPALELSEAELGIALKAFEEALSGLHRFFPEARLIVTIIPSPLSAYRLISNEVLIEQYEEGGGSLYPAAQVPLRSNRICELVANASRRVGAEFFDVRGSIRPLAERQLIHGPKDWKHFDKQGYIELGKRLSAYLEEPSNERGGCVVLN